MTNREGFKLLFTPPFYVHDGLIFDGEGKGILSPITNILLTGVKKGELLDFTVQALNEKWEHDFGEPLRWIEDIYEECEFFKCQKCGEGYAMPCKENGTWDKYKYCSNCGQRLLPPEPDRLDELKGIPLSIAENIDEFLPSCHE